MIKCLSKHVVDLNTHLNVRDKEGNTPLMVAARAGLVSIVERLIKAGADATLKNNQGYTALQIVQSSAISGIQDWTKKSIIEKLLEDAQGLRARL